MVGWGGAGARPAPPLPTPRPRLQQRCRCGHRHPSQRPGTVVDARTRARGRTHREGSSPRRGSRGALKLRHPLMVSACFWTARRNSARPDRLTCLMTVSVFHLTAAPPARSTLASVIVPSHASAMRLPLPPTAGAAAAAVAPAGAALRCPCQCLRLTWRVRRALELVHQPLGHLVAGGDVRVRDLRQLGEDVTLQGW